MVKKFGCLEFSGIAFRCATCLVHQIFEVPVLPTVEGCKRPCKE